MPDPAPIPPEAADAAKDLGEPGQPILYKYRTACQAITLLANRTVAFTCPVTFNDPLDCQWNPLWNGRTSEFAERLWAEFWRWCTDGPPEDLRHEDPKNYEACQKFRRKFSTVNSQRQLELKAERRSAVENRRKSLLETSEKIVDIAARSCRVLCLSKRNDSLPMWAHYAKEHTGIVIGFAWKTILEILPSMRMREIQYKSILSRIVDDDCLLQSVLRGVVPQNLPNLWSIISAWKHKAWEYEDEWRLILGNANQYQAVSSGKAKITDMDLAPLFVTVEPSTIREIVIGPKCHKLDVEAVKGIVAGWPIKPKIELLKWRDGCPHFEQISLP